ncbi:MAG: DNA repair protein RadC [Myxococcota bacterium]|jgi:DNA repair protein RadC|nr:DNA repair protein RadC [Myxococcota bacterium]
MSTVGSLRARANEDRPRERLGRLGGEHLSSAELLAVVLGTGQREQGDALSLAHRLLVQFGDLAGLQQARLGELQQVGGIGEVKAARVLAALEAGRRSLRPGLQPGVVLGSSQEVYRHFGPRLAGEAQELFFALALDVRNRLRREILVARGTLTSCPVHPREVFRPLVREAAASCLLVHNHPSGDPEPSSEDVSLTRRLVRAGSLLGIQVLDHLVVTPSGYVSLAERGIVP